ncbi:hypothetical protein D1816_14085 [Aquimarina sp. AD10]|uniref:polysaccharide lyase family 7 protein n=1 Tax=Aquimarina sp. AD10 TaxID=1714849 RepID=UPI000E4D740E|nr:polysaccharide lyase family 7 protein [Aquimarina sp. AD10]AXT61430.1 hypothetical protein D1816_14085 [Aquimarina sp. AD10]RKM89915.1 hypothetical protein D7033_24605 [Aquimarina sp. AD10]
MKSSILQKRYRDTAFNYRLIFLIFIGIVSFTSCSHEGLESNNNVLALQKGLPIACDIIAIKGNNGKYVTSQNTNVPITANQLTVGDSEKFEVINRSNGQIALRGNNGRYVSSENGQKAMTCNRTAIGAWELFEVIDRGASKIALRGNNGRYVSSENGNKPLNCNRSAIGSWEIFDVEEQCGGGGNNYNNPYDIPRFKDAIRKSKLQAPTSSTAATSSQLQAGYSSDWFYVVDSDKIGFYQTGSSKRTELRFLNNWNVNNGSRNAHANLKFISQSGDQTTFLQIHDDANAGNGPNKPLLRMYRSKSRGNGNHLWAAVKKDNGGSATQHIDCGPTPSGYFDCDISISNGNMTIKINGNTKVNKDVSYWNYPSYWKAGVYNQNSGGTRINFNELVWN